MSDNPIPSPTLATADEDVPEDQVLLILAVDHRASLERDLYGLSTRRC
jgi:hypothetical protein